jgi:hypothetical protein
MVGVPKVGDAWVHWGRAPLCLLSKGHSDTTLRGVGRGPSVAAVAGIAWQAWSTLHTVLDRKIGPGPRISQACMVNVDVICIESDR